MIWARANSFPKAHPDNPKLSTFGSFGSGSVDDGLLKNNSDIMNSGNGYTSGKGYTSKSGDLTTVRYTLTNPCIAGHS